MLEQSVIIVFIIAIAVLMIADFKFVGGKGKEVTLKLASIWTGIFVLASLIFAGFVYEAMGKDKAVEFITAYSIEKILSVDNLFVFVMIFQYFNVPKEYHHKVLFWGVFGAIVLRAIFIYVGIGVSTLTEVEVYGYHVNILIILFGVLLASVGIKSGVQVVNGGEDESADYSNSKGAKIINYLFKGRVTDNYVGDKFTIKRHESSTNYVRYATPLLVVVTIVEITDLFFAVDSIPAIFAVSDDPFILYSSNIFAILGLRVMYFLLASILPKFTYLKHGLAVILTFIGVKMLVSPFVHIDSLDSLYVVLSVLALCVAASLLFKPKTLQA